MLNEVTADHRDWKTKITAGLKITSEGVPFGIPSVLYGGLGIVISVGALFSAKV